jgi:hypothetical protein
LENNESDQNKSLWLCFARKSSKKKLEAKPEHDKEKEEEEMVLMRPNIKYRKNTVQKSTQCFVDRVDKSFQAGNPDCRKEDRETQINFIGHINDALKQANVGEKGVLMGSAERYSNPRYTITYLGKPSIVPMRQNPTPKEVEETYTKAKDAYNAVLASALPSESPDSAASKSLPAITLSPSSSSSAETANSDKSSSESKASINPVPDGKEPAT